MVAQEGVEPSTIDAYETSSTPLLTAARFKNGGGTGIRTPDIQNRSLDINKNMDQDKNEPKESLETHVRCPICSKELKIIQTTHIRNHGFTMDEFKLKFPDIKLISDVHKQKLLKATEIRSKLSYSSVWSPEARKAQLKGREKTRTKEPRMYNEELWNLNPDKCKNCSNNLSFELRGRKFCNKSECMKKAKSAGSKCLSKDGRSMMGIPNRLRNEDGTRKVFDHFCKYCSSLVDTDQFKINNKRVCEPCKKLNMKKRGAHMSEIQKYRSACSFKFSLNDFPEEFDFSLIEKYGWYSAANRGNNLNGVSRDHMISIMYGFKNGIPAKIISHPANCTLMRHNDNVSKSTGCSITLEELKLRIEEWDKKYMEPAIIEIA